MVETDASDFALGCVLSQYQGRRLHPVVFHSRKLNSADRNYEIHDKELLAIMEAFKEWKRYLWGEEEHQQKKRLHPDAPRAPCAPAFQAHII